MTLVAFDFDGTLADSEMLDRIADRAGVGDDVAAITERAMRGDLSYAEVWRAYQSNLEVAWDSVERLLTELDGLTAVTADHGNAMGEYASPFPIKVYGHPLGILIPALTEVPWHTYQNGDRRTIRAAAPEASDRGVDADTEARLRDLGYAE